MANFNVGDKVCYKRNPASILHVEYLVGHVGTIVSKDENYGIMWDAPFPVMDWMPSNGGSKIVTWPQYFDLTTTDFELVEAAPPVQPDAVELLKGAGFFEEAIEYDQHTVDDIVKYMRESMWYGAAAAVEKEFAEPKTRTVTVNLQVPKGESVVDYLESIGIDYDIEGDN